MLTIELTELLRVPIGRVWEVVSNPHRQHQFVGYEVTSTGQTNAVDLGPEFRWNEKGILLGKRYDCLCRVFGWEPPQWFCFGTPNLFHVSFELESNGEGTRLLYRVELPQTPEGRREVISEVCRLTVRRLKVFLEGGGTEKENVSG